MQHKKQVWTNKNKSMQIEKCTFWKKKTPSLPNVNTIPSIYIVLKENVSIPETEHEAEENGIWILKCPQYL